jgi:hypothetical protein
MRWLRGVWRETPGGSRVLWLLLWGMGTALLGAGSWGDQIGFWSSKPFVTNVFSSLTAAMFGVPLALIVLQRVGLAQAETVEARAAQEAIRRWDRSQDEDRLSALRALLDDGTLDQALEGFRSAITPGRRTVPVVAEISAHWSFLDTTVRSRLLESGRAWLAPSLAAQIDEMVRRLTTDPYLDGWLRDLDMAIGRLRNTSDLSAALRDFWIQLEMGYEFAEAVSLLGDLAAEASRALNPA